MNHLFLSVLLFTGILSSSETTEFNIGDAAPMMDYKMLNVHDEEFTLQSSLKENGLVVVFSCNTCPFVVGNEDFEGWEKSYNKLNEYAKSNDMGFILVNSNEAKRDNEDSKEEMLRRGEEQNYQMPYLIDNDSKLADAFGAKTTPHVFILSKDGKLAYKGSIDNSWDPNREKDEPYLFQAIRQIANGIPISTPTSSPKGCSIKRKK